MPRAKRRAARRRMPIMRWAAVATLAVVALLYYRPLHSYVETRSSVQERKAEVRELRAKRDELARRLREADTPEALARRARKLGLVKPGEELYIVKGVEELRRRAHTRIGGNG